MKELRKGAIEQILRYTDQAILSRHNFNCTFNKADGTLVDLSFKDNPDFFFQLLHPRTAKNESEQWRTVESPGQHFMSDEAYTHREFSAAFSAASSWVSRLVEELAFSNANGRDWINTLRENLEAVADALPEPDQPFTEAEVDDWSVKFDAMIERLKKLEDENQIQRGLVQRLQSQLDDLKGRGTTMSKRTWLKTAGYKILEVFEHGAKAGMKALAEGVVKAMLEHKP